MPGIAVSPCEPRARCSLVHHLSGPRPFPTPPHPTPPRQNVFLLFPSPLPLWSQLGPRHCRLDGWLLHLGRHAPARSGQGPLPSRGRARGQGQSSWDVRKGGLRRLAGSCPARRLEGPLPRSRSERSWEREQLGAVLSVVRRAVACYRWRPICSLAQTPRRYTGIKRKMQGDDPNFRLSAGQHLLAAAEASEGLHACPTVSDIPSHQ